jgi:nucleoside-diphosphate-sugar epimerase
MNDISVFGSTGFIGSKFCELYSDSVVRIDRNDYKTKTNNVLYFISTVDNYNVHTDLHIDIDTNLTVLMNVLETLPKNSDTTFNFISSWFVYGKNYEMPFREDYSKCNPSGFYSITKYCAEQLLISFCQTHNIKYRILRLANVIGEGDKKISKKKNALQFLIREIVNNRDVPLYYGGEVLRDYIHVEDVCSAIKLCIDKSPPNQIINIGSGKPYKFLDMINKAIEYSGSTSKIIHIEPTTFHDIVQVRHSYLDTAKLVSYGFKQKLNIDTTIEMLVNFYKKESQ